MAITAYDQPAQVQFMQTYVPMPFQELMQAGQMKQQRWETNEALRQNIETQLGDLPALRQIVLPTGEVREVGDYKHVEKRAEDYTNRIGDIVSSVEDKSSPEYRAKLTGIISDLRKDLGQQGIFGRASANVQRYQDLRKQIEDAEIGSRTHRAVDLTSQLGQFAESSQQEFTDLAAGAPILKDVDIQAKLNETMSKINDQILANPELRSEYAGKISQYGYAEGIAPDRAYRIARNLIMQDEDILSDLQARAIEQGYGEEQLNQSIDNIARNMADVYSGSTRDVSFSTDQLFMERFKKKGNLDEQLFATEINIPYAATKGVKDGEELDTTIRARRTKVQENRIEGRKFLREQYGIPEEYIEVGDNGLINLRDSVTVTDPQTGEEVVQPLDIGMDVSGEVFRINEEIRQSQKNLKDVQTLRKNAMRHANITERYFQTPQYQEVVRKARQEARDKAERVYSNISSTDPVWQNTTKEQAINEYVEDNYKDFTYKYDDRLKKMNEYLQNRTTEEGQTVNVVGMPPKMREKMETLFVDFVDDMNLEWADTEEVTGGIDEDAREDIDFEENKPRFLGFFYDQSTGNIRSMYKVYEKGEEGTGRTIKGDIPKGATRYLYENDVFDEFNSLVFNDLYNQLNGVENSYSGTGTVSLPSGEIDEKGNPINPINVNYLGQGTDGRWRVTIPTTDGQDKLLVFNSSGEVVKGLAAVSKKSHENVINNRNQ